MRSLTRRPLLAVMMMLVLGLTAFAATGCGSDDNTTSSTDSGATDSMSKTGDIVAVASDTPTLSTLVALVTQADLVETLQGEGPFTVFAPDNDAFAKLPKATTDSLMEDKNKDQLVSILTYHVVPGEYDSAKLTEIANDGGTLTTVEGGKLTPELDGDALVIKDANGDTATVVGADVKTSNGIVHVIDGVLMPKS